jgi:hypothetical protein
MQHPVKEVRQTERKDMKKLFSRLTLALSVALVASLAIAGVAIADPNLANPADRNPIPDLGITKVLDRAAGTTSPELTFQFRLTQAEPLGGGDTPTNLADPNNPASFQVMGTPNADIGPNRSITFFGVGTGEFGTKQTTLRLNNTDGFNTQASFIAGDIDIRFPHAGVFHFFLEEVHNTNSASMAADAAANPNAPATLTYSDAIHVLTFMVVNVDGQLRVAGVIAQPGTPGTPGTTGTPGNPGTGDFWVTGPKHSEIVPGTPGTDPIPGTPGEPGTPHEVMDPSAIAFTNIFTRDIRGTLQNPAFAVTKTVPDNTGLADLTIAYSTVTTLTVPQQVFDQPDPPVANPTLTGDQLPVVVDASGAPVYVDGARVTVTVTGSGRPAVAAVGDTPAVAADPFEIRAALRAGERLAFPILPAGTTFGSTEIQHADYTGTGAVFVAGSQVGSLFGTMANEGRGQNIVVPELAQHFVSDSAPFNNRIDFVNDIVHSPITGLVITSMPILAALIVATLTLAVMVASRSRRRVEQMPTAF